MSIADFDKTLIAVTFEKVDDAGVFITSIQPVTYEVSENPVTHEPVAFLQYVG